MILMKPSGSFSTSAPADPTACDAKFDALAAALIPTSICILKLSQECSFCV
jgi:hypothetical protein